ncbi:MAG: PD-(D/E)XK nuclease family protein [Gemmatimonadota bacterium]
MLIIVPTRAAAAAAADRLVRTAGEGPAGGALAARTVWTRDVATLRDVAERAAACDRAPRPQLEGAARDVLMAELIDELEPAVRQLFGPGIGAAGTPRALGAALAELRQAGLTAEQLAQATPGRRRLTALAAALHAYESRLAAGGWWDDAATVQAAAAAITAGAWPPGGIDDLVVEGLTDVTQLQGELLRALARRSRTVRIKVPFDPDNAAPYAYVYPYIKAWEELADPGLDIEITFYPENNEPGDPGVSPNPARDVLLARFGREQGAAGAAGPVDGGVELVLAADPEDEVCRLAEWVAEQARRGVRLEEIGVVVAGGRGYWPAIARAFGRHGVTYHARRFAPLTETPLFAAMLRPFRLLENGFRRDDLKAWAASPLTGALDSAGLAPLLARGPAGAASAADWQTALKNQPEGRALGIVCHLLDRLGGREHSPAEFWQRFAQVLAGAGLAPGAPGISGRAWDGWVEALGELERYLVALGRWDGPGLGWRAHRRLLLGALAGTTTKAGQAGRGVELLSPWDARGLAFRCTAIVGLAEGALIRSAAGHALLGDAEREALNARFGAGPFGPALFRTAASDANEASLLLLERVQATREIVRLSCPAQDEEGAPLVPALVFDQARSALGVGLLAGARTPLSEAGWRLAIDPEQVARLQRIERERTAFFGRDPDARRGAGGRYDADFDPIVARRLQQEFQGGRFSHWSASALETWRVCPHRFFQRYVLKLYPLEESPLEAEARQLGMLAHAALEDLYRRGWTGDRPDDPRLAEALDAADRNIPGNEKGDRHVWRILRRGVSRQLARYFRHLSDAELRGRRETVATELRFDEGSDVPAVRVPTPHGLALLRGQIDRLDRDPQTGALQVVDYKYSRKGPSDSAAVDPESCGVDHFQLYAYFLGARAWASAAGWPPPPMVSGTIHCVREPAVLDALTSPSPEDILEAVARTIFEAAGGAYDPSPRDPATCKHCDYNRSCRIATVAGVPPDEPE